MFSEIEARREKAGVQQKELCARAGVHPTRYTARKNGRSGLSERSLKRLSEALDVIIGERRDALNDVMGGDQ